MLFLLTINLGFLDILASFMLNDRRADPFEHIIVYISNYIDVLGINPGLPFS